MTNLILPEPLPYPLIHKLDVIAEIKNKFCYVIEEYPLEGIAMIIVRQHDYIGIRLADFNGKLIDVNDKGHKLYQYIEQIMKEYNQRIITTLKLIGIPKVVLYFSADAGIARLVDLRLSINKFCGPGYLHDFFAPQGIPVQNKVDTVILDEEQIENIQNAKGDYHKGSFFLKPSAFKFIIRDNIIIPLYGAIKHEIKSII